MSVTVNLGPRSYDVEIASHDLDGVGPFARARCRGSKCAVLADRNALGHAQACAASLVKSGFETTLVSRPSGESQKSLSVAAELFDRLVEAQADRQTLVAAVGGGVMGDLAGFVAATFNRGLPLLMVPTTLLAMVDSSVGGKVAVNHPRGKNLIGTFHQPIGVWIDIATLSTLPDREYQSGLAEVVKYGVILDAAFFDYLEGNEAQLLAKEPKTVEHVVTQCCRLKAQIVEKDEREETGLRAVLNYGHTFAHAFETVGGYSGWLHGEAVAAGMVCASRLAERRKLITAEVTERQIRLLHAFALPSKPPPLDTDALLLAMRADKKARAGRLHFVLPSQIGKVALVDDVPEQDVRAVLEQAQKG